MTDEKKQRSKAEILADLKMELKLDGVEEELDGKSDEEIMELFEHEGGDRKEMEAFLAEQEKEVRKLIGPPSVPERKPAEVIDLATYRRKVVRWAASSGLVGMVAAAAVVALVMHGQGGGGGVPTISPTAHGSPAEEARCRAFQACADENWTGCLYQLDKAKQYDEHSEDEPGVAKARARAMKALGMLDAGPK